ncbi:NADPH-dependent F420 reductase [Longispora fulva]|uniref:Putative dinucleotide-binding enzyme n=1 Tax=Longispora fulva TaxID=619741 RepID=A0A8J7KPU6_9ACTN|nr:NAD(P)-binding domain-containing protein [Longispora fulva]MBG6141696.1 putative dinucleotide-binding enzyme [Longispora fulva]GIG59149.1 NADPH-dependent F420 reductase [Longispora fulva]
MNIGVLGTGTVGQTIASRLVELGHSVTMGARQAGNENATAWAAAHHGRAGTFAEAAAFGALVINCTNGAGALDALAAAGEANLAGKVLIDVTNPLDFSAGMPPTLTVANTDSLAERIQAAYPATKVVKSLNTVTASVMVRPDTVPGDHVVFVAGEDAGAKEITRGLLGEFGWPEARVLDLGGIRAARGMEMYLPLWLSLYGALGVGAFNIAVHAAK